MKPWYQSFSVTRTPILYVMDDSWGDLEEAASVSLKLGIYFDIGIYKVSSDDLLRNRIYEDPVCNTKAGAVAARGSQN